jgi:endonuclease/exonuclease/phosphatase family metal-dependent hydrolase
MRIVPILASDLLKHTFLLLLAVAALASCAPPVSRVALPAAAPPCRPTTLLDAPVTWLPSPDAEASAWCEAVGPVAVGSTGAAVAHAARGNLLVVSWNMAVGAGDLEGLLRAIVADERLAGRPAPDLIVLLQEAYRTGASVPAEYAVHARVPARIAHGRRDGHDVSTLAARLRMNYAYAPSMRNGAAVPGVPAEDRGNAILSTLSLDGVTVLELPFEHQRRVAVAARVRTPAGPVTVASVHLDTRRPLWRGSIFGGPAARHRQALALIDALATASRDAPVILAGDFNTLAGPDEPAIQSLEERFVRIGCGERRTHRWGFQLDYIFASDAALLSGCDREQRRFGSDHHALIARIPS